MSAKADAVRPDATVRKPWPTSVTLEFEPSDAIAGTEPEAIQIRRQVAYDLRAMIIADDLARNNLQKMYQQVDQRWLGRPSPVVETPWDGAPEFNLQTMRDKLDQVKAFVAVPLVKADPYFLFRAGGPKGNRLDEVETIVHFFLSRRMMWPLKLAEIADLILKRGKCPTKIEYQEKSMSKGRSVLPGIRITPTAEEYFRRYPNTAVTFEEATLVGEVIQVTVEWIEQRQRDGRFFADQKIAGGYPVLHVMADPEGDKQTSSSNAMFSAQYPIDLFTGLYSVDWDEDGENEWHEVVFAIDYGVLLYETLFTSQADLYVDLGFHTETGRGRNESSIGSLLIDSHDAINYSHNQMLHVTDYVAMPPMFGAGWDLPDEVIDLRPGQVIGLDTGGQVFQGGGKVDLGAYPQIFEMQRQSADETSKVSRNGQGGNLQAGTTATEAAQVAQGQATGVEALLLLGLGPGLCQLARSIQWLLAENFDDWYEEYQDVLPAVTKEDFQKEYWIEVNGQTPIDTPAAVIAQVQGLLQAWTAAVQIDPQLQALYPDLVPELLRAFVQSTTWPDKDKVLPTREEDDQRRQQLQELQQNALANPIQAALGQGQAGPGQGAAMGAQPPEQPGMSDASIGSQVPSGG